MITSWGAYSIHDFIYYYAISRHIDKFNIHVCIILVLGMLIDDSIILAEQFYQKIEDGMEPHQAAREAAIETIAQLVRRS